jgi:hypothetical protein
MHDLIEKTLAYDRALFGVMMAVLLTVACLFSVACGLAFIWGAIFRRPNPKIVIQPVSPPKK